jgi:formylglycine-generating enzyme required for sulfatase activity/dienelactone hydrolase
VVELIGSGGMGEVYRARDPRLGRDVAIKVLPAEYAADSERLRRFEQEARAVAALSHPNILAIFDVGSAPVSSRAEGQVSSRAGGEGSAVSGESVHYLVTELLEGESLRERLRSGPLPVRKAVELGVGIANGLAAAHERGIIHRDLKPGNLFITRDGHVKILDFGVAKLTPLRTPEDQAKASTIVEATEAGMVLGTLGYMSPEQIRGQTVDHRSDIFAFGCVLYEMLSGKRAFTGASAADTLSAVLHEDPPRLVGTGKDIGPPLDRIVTRCLEKQPGDRFTSAHDLSLALEAIVSGRRERALAGTVVGRALSAVPARLLSGIAAVVAWSRAKPLPKLLAAVGVVAVVALLTYTTIRQRRVAWAHATALPELQRFIEAKQYWPAFLLARKISAAVPDDPTLKKLRPQFEAPLQREMTPVGARVLARRRDGSERDWVELGEVKRTPLVAPLGYSVFRVEHPGFEPVELAMSVSEFGWPFVEGTLALAKRGELPEGMVLIETPARKMYFGLAAILNDFSITEEGHLASFFVDQYEVTNHAYKLFVAAGGYQKPEYWKEPFERDGRTLAWHEAMALLRDTTGRPGPAGWELGNYPEGKDDYPVTGVSWYEAAAYAAFGGKRLPSLYHWGVAGASSLGGDFLAGSNFSGKLAPVGSYRGSLNCWGLYDVAGNAREWCSNASDNGRFVVGGACDGPTYMFWHVDAKSPFDRDPTTGFRCVKPVAQDPNQAQLDAPIARKPPIDWEKQKPFSEDTWRNWQGLLSYAKTPLDARVEWSDDTIPTWRMEKVSFAAAYGNERVIAYLYLPRSVPPPWQVVVFWPGGYAPEVSSSEDGRNTLDASYWSYLVKDGRAVLYPILKGTFERGGHAERVVELSMDHCIFEAKDVFRSIDYLETRSDIQKDRIGFLGFSWGGIAGPFVCSVEKRIKAEVLLGGGLYEPQMLGFISRCTTPTEMINGRFDGYAESQAPMFRALGAPADQKRHVVYESDHALAAFQKDVVKVSLEWFDRFLGPVR